MATYRITTPDGTVFEVTAPATASPDEVRRFAMQSAPKLETIPQEKPNALVRFGRGMSDLTEGVTQAAKYIGEKANLLPEGAVDAYTKARDEDIAAYEKGRGPDAGIDWMRLGGNVVASLPVAAIPGASAASMGARVASGAAQGAVASGAMFTPEGQSKTAQTVIGAGAGGIAPAALEGIKRGLVGVYQKFRGAPQVNPQILQGEIRMVLEGQGVNVNQLSDDVLASLVKDAQQAVKVDGNLNPAQLARKADIENVGATPFKAAITREPRDWQQFKNLRGVEDVGEGIVRVEQENAQALTDALQRIGSGGKTKYQVGESVIDAVSQKSREMQSEVGKLYRKADQEFGGAMTAKPESLLEKVGELSVRADADPIMTTINRYLTRRGVLDKEGNTQGYLSLKESEELRKLIRDVSWDKGRSMRQIGNDLIEALDDDVFRGFPEGSPYAVGRQAAKARFDEFSTNSLKRITDDSVTPDAFVTNYVMGKGKVDELRQLKKVLTTGTKDQLERGAAAWSDIKGAFLDNLMLRSTGATSLDDIAGKPFSGRNFSKALDGIELEKLHLIFTPTELDSLRQLQRASKLLTEEVPFSDVNYSKTGAMVANLMKKIGQTPILGAVMRNFAGEGKVALSGRVPVQPGALNVPRLRGESVVPGAAGGMAAEANQ